MRNYSIPLLPGGLYHVLNRANGWEQLFREEKNYHYFQDKYIQHTSPVAQTLAWCLLPNHYHFLVRIKDAGTLKEIYDAKNLKQVETDNGWPVFIMKQFSNWQNAYAKAFNKAYNRKGSLFTDSMRRIEINKDTQLGNTVFYIHKNPVHHQLKNKIDEWQWASYKEYASGSFTVVDTNEVFEWFGTTENFIVFHQQPIAIKKDL